MAFKAGDNVTHKDKGKCRVTGVKEDGKLSLETEDHKQAFDCPEDECEAVEAPKEPKREPRG